MPIVQTQSLDTEDDDLDGVYFYKIVNHLPISQSRPLIEYLPWQYSQNAQENTRDVLF